MPTAQLHGEGRRSYQAAKSNCRSGSGRVWLFPFGVLHVPPRPTLHLYVRDRNSDAEQAIVNWAQRAVSDIETQVTELK